MIKFILSGMGDIDYEVNGNRISWRTHWGDYDKKTYNGSAFEFFRGLQNLYIARRLLGYPISTKDFNELYAYLQKQHDDFLDICREKEKKYPDIYGNYGPACPLIYRGYCKNGVWYKIPNTNKP